MKKLTHSVIMTVRGGIGLAELHSKLSYIEATHVNLVTLDSALSRRDRDRRDESKLLFYGSMDFSDFLVHN